MEELYRILDSDDVATPRIIDLINQSCESRGFTGSGGTCNQDQTPSFLGHRFKHWRKAQFLDCFYTGRNNSKYQSDRATLLVDIAAKAAETGHANGGLKGQTVGEIDALVNARFFADAVAATHGERVRISILDPKRPIRVEPEPAPKDWQQVAVIMPILPK